MVLDVVLAPALATRPSTRCSATSLAASRAKRIVVQAVTADGLPLAVESHGFEARALQHEIDHLDGILSLDRLVSASDLFQRRDYG